MTREMEDMFKQFGAVEFFPGIQQPDSSKIPQNPRDHMLKDSEGNDSKPSVIQPHKFWSPFRGPFSSRLPIAGKKEDKDLDGKLEVDDVAKLFDKSSSQLETITQPRIFSSRQSISVSTFRGPDGSLEQKRTVRNSDGTEETTITRSKGEQSHTVTIKRDKAGIEEKIENFNNMDESDVRDFNKSWNSPHQQPTLPYSDQLLKDKDNQVNTHNSDESLFNKFFGSWLKPKS